MVRGRLSIVKGPQEMSRQSNTRSIAAGLFLVALLWGCEKAPVSPTVKERPEATPAEVVEAGKDATPAPESPRPEDAVKPVADADVQKETRAIIEEAGVKGGLVVHLGCGDGKETARLFAGGSSLVQGLDTDEASVMEARDHLRSEKLYGRITATQFDGRTLPYRDNLVNMIVATAPGSVSRKEMIRVLAPRGIALIKEGRRWSKVVKPGDDGTKVEHLAGRRKS